MSRAILSCCVILTIFGYLNSANTSCRNVKTEFSKLSSLDSVPDFPIIDPELQICRKSLTSQQASCCSRDSEMKYLVASEQYLTRAIQDKNAYLKPLITSHMGDYQDKVLALVRHTRNSTGDIMTDWYSVPWSEHRLALGKFFTDIEEFIKLKNVIIKTSVSNFFDQAFPVIFKNIIYRQPVDTWSHHYHHCLAQHRQEITPKVFGKFPLEISNSLQKGLALGRAYLEALSVVIETINTTDNLLLEDECKHAVTRMQYCSHCRGFVGVKPCKGFCLDVMRGCLSKLSEIGPEYNSIISSVENLVREMSEKNMDEVFKDLVVGISEAFMHAMVKAPQYYQNVHELCGIPLTESGTVETRTPDFTRKHALNPAVTGPLSMDVMKVTLDLVDSKGLYTNLADDICAESTLFEQDALSGSCWNGTEVSIYLREAVNTDILSQARDNKEVKVSLILDPNIRNLKDKLAIVNHNLQSHTRKVEGRHRGKTTMISDDPEVYDHSGQEGVVGNVNIGLGSTLHDDEDLFEGDYYSGDGSGYSGDRGIDTVIETGNGEVSFPDNKPNQPPYEVEQEGNLGPDRPQRPRGHQRTSDPESAATSIHVSISALCTFLVICIIHGVR